MGGPRSGSGGHFVNLGMPLGAFGAQWAPKSPHWSIFNDFYIENNSENPPKWYQNHLKNLSKTKLIFRSLLEGLVGGKSVKVLYWPIKTAIPERFLEAFWEQKWYQNHLKNQ